jgi:hypothetical protein
MSLSNQAGKCCGELILDLGEEMMQLRVVVRRDCQYLRRVNQASPRDSSTYDPPQRIKAVISGEHDMMLFTLGCINQDL